MTYHDPWATSERQALRKLVADFTQREIAPHMDQWERDGAVPRSLHRQAGELGLLELGFPESVGGAGDYVDLMIVVEELIANGGSAGLCASLLTHTIATPHIAAVGDPEQVAKYVRPTLAGNKIGALAITEKPGAAVSTISSESPRWPGPPVRTTVVT